MLDFLHEVEELVLQVARDWCFFPRNDQLLHSRKRLFFALVLLVEVFLLNGVFLTQDSLCEKLLILKTSFVGHIGVDQKDFSGPVGFAQLNCCLSFVVFDASIGPLLNEKGDSSDHSFSS